MWSYNNTSELYHHGILGMKWGHHETTSETNSKHTTRLANKDAKRYADAKMFYGKTAGTKRKLLKAELDKKKSTIPGYEEQFNKALENVDFSKSAKKAVVTRKTKDTAYRVRVTTKQVLGVTGPLTVAAGMAVYRANKPAVDAYVAKQLTKAVSTIQNYRR